LRIKNGGEELQLRKPKYRQVDQKLTAAKQMLFAYLTRLHENGETIGMDQLLM